MRASKRGRRARLGRSSLLSLAILLAAALASPRAAAAQGRGIQTTPDGKLMLLNKDINGERWSISLNLRDGTAIGNIFPSNGGAPSFVWCSAASITLAKEPTDTQYTLDCYGASACSQLPCGPSGWTHIGTVNLAGSIFFAP
jgi:hypothetical protein